LSGFKTFFDANKIAYCVIDPGYSLETIALADTASGLYDDIIRQTYDLGAALVQKGDMELALALAHVPSGWAALASSSADKVDELHKEITDLDLDVQAPLAGSRALSYLGAFAAVNKLRRLAVALNELRQSFEALPERDGGQKCQRAKLLTSVSDILDVLAP
jgi:hypothetical protein